MTPAEIEKRMGGSAQYVFAARRLDPVDLDAHQGAIRCSARSSRRVRSSREQEPSRIYPKGGLAAQVVGVDGDGLSGVELLPQRRAQRA